MRREGSVITNIVGAVKRINEFVYNEIAQSSSFDRFRLGLLILSLMIGKRILSKGHCRMAHSRIVHSLFYESMVILSLCKLYLSNVNYKAIQLSFVQYFLHQPYIFLKYRANMFENIAYIGLGFVAVFFALESAWHLTACRIHDKSIKPCFYKQIGLLK
jgi:hypothetical protein